MAELTDDNPEIALDLQAMELELALRLPELERALEALRAAERLDQAVLDLVITI